MEAIVPSKEKIAKKLTARTDMHRLKRVTEASKSGGLILDIWPRMAGKVLKAAHNFPIWEGSVGWLEDCVCWKGSMEWVPFDLDGYLSSIWATWIIDSVNSR